MVNEVNHILYVDDEPEMELLVKATLESSGKFTVTTCSNPIDFLLTAMESKPDLILLDVMMDWMSGTEVIQEIAQHENLSGIPVVFITSRAEQDDIQKYIDVGAAGVIPKPFDILTFPARIESFLKD